MEKIRIQKYFTDCGIMSRRAAEKEITEGNVTINGITAALGDKIDPETDRLFWNGEEIKPAPLHSTYIMLNKPMGYVTTMSDEKGRKTASELVSDAGVRVYPVGRLDMYSEGLLIFTNDGDTANKLMHPSGNISKTYSVKLKGNLSDKEISLLTEPMELDGYALLPIEVELKKRDIDRDGVEYTVLHITLHEGRNRQIRRMCEKCSFKVMRLCRITECGISLGNLPSGKWRYLTEKEIKLLKE